MVLSIAVSWQPAAAQETDTLSAESALSYADSLNIFTLIDSLLSMDDPLGSQLAVRLSYNSNVLSNGRTLGIEQFGLTPSLTYYHKSGAYADVSGYWSQDFVPHYYLTVTSVGYMRIFSKHFTAMAGYDRYWYHGTDDNNYIPYNNTLSVTPILDVKPFSLSVSYSFYFGDQTAHRILPGLSVTLQKRKLWGIDRIAITPAFYMLYGNEVVTEIRYPETLREIIRRIILGELPYDIIEHNVFGVMNYAITLPLSITYHDWGLMVAYTYNIPKALPGEPLTLSESGFLSASLSYYLQFRSNKKPW